VGFAIRDDFHNKGIGTELLSYLANLAKREGLLGFTAEVYTGSQQMLHIFEKGGFDIKKKISTGAYDLKDGLQGIMLIIPIRNDT